MRSKQAAAPKQARPAAPSCRPAVWPPCGREVQEVVKKNLFCCKKKPFRRSSDSLNGLRRQVRSLKKVFFYNRKGFFLLHFVPGRMQPPKQAQLPACSLAHMQEGMQEVVKKNIFCCKKKPFWRSSDSLNGLRRQVCSRKKVFFYNIKGFFYYNAFKAGCSPQADQACSPQLQACSLAPMRKGGARSSKKKHFLL